MPPWFYLHNNRSEPVLAEGPGVNDFYTTAVPSRGDQLPASIVGLIFGFRAVTPFYGQAGQQNAAY